MGLHRGSTQASEPGNTAIGIARAGNGIGRDRGHAARAADSAGWDGPIPMAGNGIGRDRGHAARAAGSAGCDGHARGNEAVVEMAFLQSMQSEGEGSLYSSQSETTSVSSQSSLISSRGSSLSYVSSLTVKELSSVEGEEDEEAAARVHYKCVGTGRSWAIVATGLAGGRGLVDAEKMVGGMQEAAGSPVRAVVRVGERLFSAHDDHKIRVWEHPGPPSSCAPAAESACRHVATLPSLLEHVLASLSSRNYVQVRRHHKRLWMQHVDAISALAVGRLEPADAGGRSHVDVLYSASWDRTVKVWRLSDLRCVESFKAHDDAVNAIAVSPDGRFLYTGSADALVRVWLAPAAPHIKTTGHSLLDSLAGHKSAVNALAVSPDGALLYSGACDKAILVWQRSSSRDGGPSANLVLAGALRGHRRAVLCMAALQRGHFHALCSGSADRTVRVWQRLASTSTSPFKGAAHVCVAVLHGHSGPVKSLSVSASTAVDPITLYSACLRHEIKVWNISID